MFVNEISRAFDSKIRSANIQLIIKAFPFGHFSIELVGIERTGFVVSYGSFGLVFGDVFHSVDELALVVWEPLLFLASSCFLWSNN